MTPDTLLVETLDATIAQKFSQWRRAITRVLKDVTSIFAGSALVVQPAISYSPCLAGPPTMPALLSAIDVADNRMSVKASFTAGLASTMSANNAYPGE